MQKKYTKIFIVLSLCIVNLLCYNNEVFANGITTSNNSSIDDIIDKLTGELLADVYIEVKNDYNFNQMTEIQKNEYVINKIVQHYKKSQKYVTMGLSNYLPDSYNALNDEEKRLVRRYPVEAITYYYAGKEAYSETGRVFGRNLADDASDAFRHSYWNAILVNLFYVNQMDSNWSTPSLDEAIYITEKWTTAHEFDSEGLPKEMDLYNNRIGRNIGARYIQRKLSFISDTVYNAVKNGETLMIEGYRLVPTRI